VSFLNLSYYYESLGYAVQVYIPPSLTAIRSSISLNYNTTDIAVLSKKIVDKIPTTGKFGFHVFSNAGCFLWESIRDELAQANNTRWPSGLVFDSGPAEYSDTFMWVKVLQYCTEEEKKLLYSKLIRLVRRMSEKEQDHFGRT